MLEAKRKEKAIENFMVNKLFEGIMEGTRIVTGFVSVCDVEAAFFSLSSDGVRADGRARTQPFIFIGSSKYCA